MHHARERSAVPAGTVTAAGGWTRIAWVSPDEMLRRILETDTELGLQVSAQVSGSVTIEHRLQDAAGGAVASGAVLTDEDAIQAALDGVVLEARPSAGSTSGSYAGASVEMKAVVLSAEHGARTRDHSTHDPAAEHAAAAVHVEARLDALEARVAALEA